MMGDVFEPGDPIRVFFGIGNTLDALVMAVQPHGHPWNDRTKLITVFLRNGSWSQTWWHADDPDVRHEPEAAHLSAQWAAHVLIHGEPPIGIKT